MTVRDVQNKINNILVAADIVGKWLPADSVYEEDTKVMIIDLLMEYRDKLLDSKVVE